WKEQDWQGSEAGSEASIAGVGMGVGRGRNASEGEVGRGWKRHATSSLKRSRFLRLLSGPSSAFTSKPSSSRSFIAASNSCLVKFWALAASSLENTRGA